MAAGKSSEFQIPAWARSFIKVDEAHRIAEAVAQVEHKTTGEIVPMIVHRSTSVGHVPLMLTLILLLILMVFELPYHQALADNNATWVLLILAALCFVISIPLAKLAWVQRLLVPPADQSFQAEERALLEFYQAGLTETRGNTGILIFISLMERKAVILADKGISSRLPNETWDQLCQDMIKAIKEGKTAEGLISTIHRSGELLAQHFPGHHENENELSNLLILKE